MSKYATVGFIRSDSKKKVRRTRVEREDRPGTAGYQTEHWSGRVDAVATPDVARGVGTTKE